MIESRVEIWANSLGAKQQLKEEEAVYELYKDWHNWFAIHPVKLNWENKTVVFKTIKRARIKTVWFNGKLIDYGWFYCTKEYYRDIDID